MRAALVVLFVMAVAGAVEAAPRLALLPAVGDAPEAQRRSVDNALRRALAVRDDVELQSPVETRQHVASAADMGLSCEPDDAMCVAKVGITAGVDRVLVPRVERAGDMLAVEIGVIDVGTGAQQLTVSGRTAASDDAALGALALRAIGVEPPPPPHDGIAPDKGANGTGNGTSTTAGSGTNGTGTSDSSGVGSGQGNGTGNGDTGPGDGGGQEQGPPVGLILAGVGGGVAALAITGAVLSDLIYADVLDVADAKTRRDIVQPAGIALWITSGVSLAVLGSGIALFLTEGAAEAGE